MKVEKTTIPDNLKLRGRSFKYPFDKLTPGNRIVMESTGDIKKDRQKIVQACYQYKKYNNLKWVTASDVEDNKIILYRIS